MAATIPAMSRVSQAGKAFQGNQNEGDAEEKGKKGAGTNGVNIKYPLEYATPGV
jgi:hypothetical protein